MLLWCVCVCVCCLSDENMREWVCVSAVLQNVPALGEFVSLLLEVLSL